MYLNTYIYTLPATKRSISGGRDHSERSLMVLQARQGPPGTTRDQRKSIVFVWKEHVSKIRNIERTYVLLYMHYIRIH